MLNIISREIIEERKEPEMDSIEERGSSSEEASARQYQKLHSCSLGEWLIDLEAPERQDVSKN